MMTLGLRAGGPAFLALVAIAPLMSGASVADEFQATFLRASAESFSRPHDLVLSPDRKRLYVADVGNDVVKVLDPVTLKMIGHIGKDDLDSPHDVAFDAAGRLLVADSGNDRIVVYRIAGKGGERVAVHDADQASPEGVAAAPDGRIYITNAGSHTVIAVHDGRTVKTAGGDGDAVAFRRPHDLHFDGRGRLIVTDPGNDRLQILDTELRPLGTLAGPPYNFNEPKYLAADAKGRLYVADENNNRILVLDAADRPIGQIGSGRNGKGPNLFNKPEGVEVWRDRVWISDTYNDRIVLYRIAP